ncbi:bifunctional 3-phenylpropionate/cinnamic acid dioxygenase ferredoxin subunit [Salinifilum ghardaiensis]
MIFVGELSDLPPGESVRVEGDVAIAVFNVDGELHAIDDTCTHQDASLSDGWLEGCAVECPLHASCFDLRTGRPDGPPAKKPVRTHEVSLHDGLIYVHESTRAGADTVAAADAVAEEVS